ncbi:MAG: hypothetical protein GY705_03655 [Bacteroidetes bacterium]|nr:hypothetical protein [Bacteroidota bacterium]
MKFHSLIKLCMFVLFFCFLQNLALSQVENWEPTGIGGGGALFVPSISPFDADEIFVASDLGAMFHSTSTGTEWDVLNFREIIATTHSKVNFTDQPNILYSITTNGWQTFPIKSTDGGVNWSFLPNDPTFAEAYYLFADPGNSDRLLLSSYSQLFFSEDGGNSFEMVYSADDLYLSGVFWDGSNIFVGCRTGLVVSIDNGISFSQQTSSGDLPADFGMLSFAGAKEGNTVRLFCVARNNGSMWPGMQGSEFWDDQDVFRLDWGDPMGWQLANNGIVTDDFPFYISMPLNDIETVYVAGATATPNFPMVYKSSDAGNNWENTFLVNNNENIFTGWQCNGGDKNWWWGETAMGFTVSPNDPSRAVITDFGFIHLTTDGGVTWRQAYVDPASENLPDDTDNEKQNYQSVGMEQTSCWWANWSDADNIFVGFSDFTGIRSRDGGESWSFDYQGNDYNSTYHIVRHPESHTLYAATSDVHDIYQSTRLGDDLLDDGTGEILFSNDEGANWQTLHNFNNPVI